jgi:hypothetical protein
MAAAEPLSGMNKAPCGKQLKILLGFLTDLRLLVPGKHHEQTFRAVIVTGGGDVLPVFVFFKQHVFCQFGIVGGWSPRVKELWSEFALWMCNIIAKDRFLKSTCINPEECDRLFLRKEP